MHGPIFDSDSGRVFPKVYLNFQSQMGSYHQRLLNSIELFLVFIFLLNAGYKHLVDIEDNFGPYAGTLDPRQRNFGVSLGL